MILLKQTCDEWNTLSLLFSAQISFYFHASGWSSPVAIFKSINYDKYKAKSAVLAFTVSDHVYRIFVSVDACLPLWQKYPWSWTEVPPWDTKAKPESCFTHEMFLALNPRFSGLYHVWSVKEVKIRRFSALMSFILFLSQENADLTLCVVYFCHLSLRSESFKKIQKGKDFTGCRTRVVISLCSINLF